MEHLFELIVVCLVPGIELRGSIPLGALWNVDPVVNILVSIITNIMIIPVGYVGLNFFWKYLSQIGFLDRHVQKVRARTKPSLDKYGFLGLAMFVAVPLPLTGAYMGTLLAWLLGMEKKRALPSIALGVLAAAAIVSTIVYGSITALNWLV